MPLRLATWLAILVGGTGGVVTALVGSGSTRAAASLVKSSAPASLELASTAQTASLVPLSTPAPDPSSTVTPVLSSAPQAKADSSAAAPAGRKLVSAAQLPAAELLPLPSTARALLRAEMLCDQRKAESCIVAARSYETGSAGATDAEKAFKYRRIALTVWISQCDHNSAEACATLSTMYRAGSGVPQSTRNADALVARARELCRFNDAPACHELPNR